jgi:hypothetical protein
MVERGQLMTQEGARLLPPLGTKPLCKQHAIKHLVEFYERPEIRTRAFAKCRNHNFWNVGANHRGVRCEFVKADGARCRNSALSPRKISRRRRHGEPIAREQVCIVHLKKMIRDADARAPRVFNPHARRCKALCSGISRPSRRRQRCRNVAVKGFEVCMVHGGAAGRATKGKPRVIRGFTKEQLRAKQRQQTREAIRRQAERQARQANGEVIGVRAPPPPPPTPGPSLWDQFTEGRRQPREELPGLYPGTLKSRY